MPHSYSPTCHQVVFESLPRLSQYLRISPAISSGDPEWSFHMPRELGQRFGKLSFDSATWKDIWSMVTKLPSIISFKSVAIPVIDKEKLPKNSSSRKKLDISYPIFLLSPR